MSSVPFIEALVKHLPPSIAQMRVLDINGVAGAVISALRPDAVLTITSGDMVRWDFPPESFDAVVACDYILNTPFLNAVLPLLRPGGRVIIVNARGVLDEAYGTKLEEAGYIRILIEDALQNPPRGVLIRGEKAHTTADTHQRILRVADAEAEFIPISQYKGRYLHLLIQQTPNKPPWRFEPDEIIHWEAVGITSHTETRLLAFSSLPKAVGFMQPSIMTGKFYTVNKVAKFKRDVLLDMAYPLWFNPTMTIWDRGDLIFIPVTRDLAEAPDE